jgi:transposase InsO family protein
MGYTPGMPWKHCNPMTELREFLDFARQPGANIRALCARFLISRKTGYKWLARTRALETSTPEFASRRPQRSPRTTGPELTAAVLALRAEHPTWGGRKLRRRLQDLQMTGVPAASTCTEILRRAGQLRPPEERSKPLQRFERGAPNELWQMDHKGHYPLQRGGRCHPLTIVDDHSRFNLVLHAGADETGATVRAQLTPAFERYGLPEAILCDNGAPWGAGDPVCPYTTLTVWLLRLGVRVLHGRPYHPQTQGKDERFHRTLQGDLIDQHTWRDLEHCAELFARYREIYNCVRPHDSLDGDVPIKHYQPSPRPFPAVLPVPHYDSGIEARRVRSSGTVTFHNQTWYIGRAFAGLPIGLRPSAQADGQWQVYFAHHLLGLIDLTTPLQPKHRLRSIY